MINMRVIKDIPIQSIKIDSHPINKSTLDLVDHIRNGGKIPPIKIAKSKLGNYVIRDGRHRVTAYKLLGLSHITAKYSLTNMYYL